MYKLDSEFCFNCKEFPCKKLEHIDKRYKTKYNMSMIENLISIKIVGIRKFSASEKIKWTCQYCGGTICVHKGICFTCGENYFPV